MSAEVPTNEAEVTTQPVKCVRARMIIELEDGRAVYWEARDPQKAEFESLAAESLTWEDVLSGKPLTPQPRAVLKITGGIPWLVQSYRDSGEIPPELAEDVLRSLDDQLTRWADPMAALRPYLSRIAGRQA